MKRFKSATVTITAALAVLAWFAWNHFGRETTITRTALAAPSRAIAGSFLTAQNEQSEGSEVGPAVMGQLSPLDGNQEPLANGMECASTPTRNKFATSARAVASHARAKAVNAPHA